ncbi:hypothetical protein SUNI508_11931 [Seiridium unicorne]|uniref:Uncharacterized protein n=1 Tax=Seiridium unicorne TaxID=138068 RepID=A0ABR2UFX6_9PEZI
MPTVWFPNMVRFPVPVPDPRPSLSMSSLLSKPGGQKPLSRTYIYDTWPKYDPGEGKLPTLVQITTATRP